MAMAGSSVMAAGRVMVSSGANRVLGLCHGVW